MQTFSATEARANQSAVLDIAASGEAVTITRRVGGNVVVISEADYQAFKNAAFDAEFDQILHRHGKALKDLADR